MNSTVAVKKRVLVVDDDEPLREALASQLDMHEGYDVVQAGNGSDALERARGTTFDTILLDLVLPDLDGREVCRILRRNSIATPVIVLTAATSDADEILSLDAGANDVVTKPFRIAVLLARVRAHMRQYASSADAAFTVGPYLYKPGARLLVERGSSREVMLSDTENSILRMLCRAAGAAVTRQELYEQIWGFKAPLDTHTLQTHVYRLRRKIEVDPGEPRLLLSEHQGYRLVP
jgi:DNA-binding response OmpR family regulator